MQESTITDRRLSRDLGSNERSAVPFGQSFVSRVTPIGSRQTSSDRYTAVPMAMLGDPIVYDSMVGNAIAFPNGLTEWYPAIVGRTYLPSPATIEAIDCNATVSSSPLKTSVLVTSITGSPSGWNASTLSPNLYASVTAVDRPYVNQGVSGYSIEALVRRPLLPGELELSGFQYSIVKPSIAPTMPEVFLRLWIALDCADGSTEGLDLPSIRDAILICRSRGFYYNGDVSPDYLEAWLYQAAYSHGLRATRSRIGIGFEAIGIIANVRYLFTSANNQSLVRSWQEIPIKKTQVRSIVRHSKDTFVDVGNAIVGNRSHVEELIGVRPSDANHIAAIQAFWDSDRQLSEQVSGTFVGNRSTGFGLTLGTVVLLPEIGRGQFNGSIVALKSGVIVPSWDSVLITGYTDAVGNGALTDLSKDFTASVQPGDLLELTGTDGILTYATVTAVTLHSLTATNTSATIASYKVYDLTPEVGWTIAVQTATGVSQIPVIPSFDKDYRKVTYTFSNLTPELGAAISIGQTKNYKIVSVRGPEWGAIG